MVKPLASESVYFGILIVRRSRERERKREKRHKHVWCHENIALNFWENFLLLLLNTIDWVI